TRWPRDWSSDVCSSDLPDVNLGQSLKHERAIVGIFRDGHQINRATAFADRLFFATEGGIDLCQYRESARIIVMSLRFYFQGLARSEERRVGKEGMEWGG